MKTYEQWLTENYSRLVADCMRDFDLDIETYVMDEWIEYIGDYNDGLQDLGKSIAKWE